MQSSNKLSKDKIYNLLLEVSKEYKKLSNRQPIQLIIVGGASIILNYGFRDSTIDIDAYYGYSDVFRQAIKNVSDKFNYSIDIINDDFKFTESFSNKLVNYSTYYHTFSNVVEVRVIKAEYLIAMKLIASRKYKHDRSDIIGILKSESDQGNTISLEMIKTAFINLYGSWDKLDEESKNFIESAMKIKDLSSEYDSMIAQENNIRNGAKEVFKNIKIERSKDSLNRVIAALEKTEKKQ